MLRLAQVQLVAARVVRPVKVVVVDRCDLTLHVEAHVGAVAVFYRLCVMRYVHQDTVVRMRPDANGQIS